MAGTQTPCDNTRHHPTHTVTLVGAGHGIALKEHHEYVGTCTWGVQVCPTSLRAWGTRVLVLGYAAVGLAVVRFRKVWMVFVCFLQVSGIRVCM